jgi:hypothetical protein
MLEELESSIRQLQQVYFNELSSSIKAEAIDSGTPFFADPQLAQYFQNACNSYDVAEYYYLTNPSRFTLNTHKGEKLICLIYTDEDLAEQLQILVEENAPKPLISALESREFIPLFLSEDGFYDPGIPQSSARLYPADHIQGGTNYYCAIIPEDTHEQPPKVKPSTGNNLH